MVTEGCFFGGPGLIRTGRRREKKKSKTDRDSVVHDHSFTQIFVRRTMMALESVLLWCLTVFLFFFHLAF